MNKKTKKMTLCALMAALSTVIMLLGGILPVMTYCSPMIASLVLVCITEYYGKKWAFLTYLVTAMLSLLLSPDKESAFFFVFFAWYPLLKPSLDQRIRNKFTNYLVKILLFSFSTFFMYFLTCRLLGIAEIVESFSSVALINTLFYVLIVVVMVLYDFMLNAVSRLLKRRFQKFF